MAVAKHSLRRLIEYYATRAPGQLHQLLDTGRLHLLRGTKRTLISQKSLWDQIIPTDTSQPQPIRMRGDCDKLVWVEPNSGMVITRQT
jgi:hypothetical protein